MENKNSYNIIHLTLSFWGLLSISNLYFIEKVLTYIYTKFKFIKGTKGIHIPSIYMFMIIVFITKINIYCGILPMYSNLASTPTFQNGKEKINH